MKNESNKKIKIISIVIIFLIILIGIAFSILYFFTDTFKTKKELYTKNFVTFFAQSGQTENRLTEYFNKKATSTHTNNGSFKTNIEMSSEEYQDYTDSVNNMNIIFNGSTNPSQKQAEQNIEIQYSDDVVFPINYLRDNDLYGLQNDYISNKYIAVENNNLKELAEKFGLTNVDELPNKIEITNQNQNISYTEEETKSLQEKYMPLLDVITDEKITVEKTDNNTKYILNTTSLELKDTLVKFLEILKDDEITLNKINTILEGYDTYIEKEKIEEIIQSIQEQEIEEQNITISINTQKNVPISINIESETTVITINKQNNNDEAIYSLDINVNSNNSSGTAQTTILSIKAQYTGISTDNVSEKYTVIFGTEGEETVKYEYNFENQISFTDNIQIDNLTSDNAMILNDYSSEQITSLLTAVVNRIVEVNADQMQELGIQYSPILMMTPLGTLNMMIVGTAQDTIQDTMQENNMSETVIQSFNAKFTKYQGNIKGTMVKSLIQEINSNNAMYEDEKTMQILLNNSLSPTTNPIENSKIYNVVLHYGNNGKVDEIYLYDGENNTTDMVNFGKETKNVNEDETRKNRTASGKETIMLEYNKCLTDYYANKYQNGEEVTKGSLIEYILNNIQSTEANKYITEIKESEMTTNLEDENGNIITATVTENGKIIWSDDNK